MFSNLNVFFPELEPTGENRRVVIGDAIYNIRFLAMSKEDFCQNVSLSGLLTVGECAGILRKFDGAEESALKWTELQRRPRAGLMDFSRFDLSGIDLENCDWKYTEREPDMLAFTVNKSVWFHGV